jgi:drug/metabolite transporter (DMT)-like permease
VFGGVFGPACFMLGLSRLDAAAASLLLNLEAVLTAILAWVVFRENADRRIVAGMAAIVAGGVVLSWPAGDAWSIATVSGVAWIAAACACWALDNNLTRKVSGADAVFVAGTKGLVAGAVLCCAALAAGAPTPTPGVAGAAMVVGLLGYGASLVCFVLALRALGTARTGAYFSTSPFVGAALALLLPPRAPDAALVAAAALMAIGVWLHATERHVHAHTHEGDLHEHPHVHDEHHRHAHAFAWDGSEPHRHPHRHEPMAHAHPHAPDLHHRHRH